VAALAVLLALCGPLRAGDEAELLHDLAGADAAAAQAAERELLAQWRRSGSPSMDLLLQRGRDALERGDTAAAIGHLTALTDHAPDFAEGWHARASAFFHAGQYGPALADLGRALTLNPNQFEAIYGLGTILEDLGDDRRAHAAYTRAKAIHPHHEDVTSALERLEPRIRGEAL
jgi:tetratricopeptide (TPR) repeat protein